MSIDVALILARPALIIGLALGVVTLKVLVLRLLARFFGGTAIALIQ